MVGFATAPVLRAHNLDTRATSIFFDPSFVGTMSTRGAANAPLLQVNDEFWIILKTTPGPGTLTGVGGYQTFYVPSGVQVIGAEIVEPDPSAPSSFRTINAHGQSIIATGAGSIGAKASPTLLGMAALTNFLGRSELPVVAGTAIARGTIAGVYADTGIFYSTNANTAFNSYNAPSNASMVNNSGDTVGEYDAANITGTNILGVMTLWDSYQLRAYGRKDVIAIIDPVDQRGNAPWGLASAVAGPQSGYNYEFNYQTYTNTVGTEAQKVQAAIRTGPWLRIRYPGSQVSSDTAGSAATTLGYAGIDGSSYGVTLSSGSPLPTTTTAVRFAIGMLELGRPQYARVKVKVLTLPSVDCPVMYADAFGGDAGGEQGGKDHIWRYFDPTVVSLQPCVLLQKVASTPTVAPGGTLYFDITFANNSSISLPSVALTDTLPSGLTHLSSVPVQNAGPNPLVYNLGTLAPGAIRTIRVNVQATATGTLLNTVVASTNGVPIATAEETVLVGNQSLLSEVKSVSPSTANPGGTVVYTLTVSNSGNAANGSPLVINELLPTGFTYVSAVSTDLNGGTPGPGVVSVNTANPNRPVFTVTQGINAGKTLVLKFNVLVGATVAAGTYCNQVSLNFESKTVSGVPEACLTVGGGSIGDTVYSDTDGDGTQDVGEPGISGVTVTLYNDVNNNGIWDAGDTVVTTKVTDASGNYLFSALPDGNYVVKLNSPPAGTNTQNPSAGPTDEGAATITGANSVLTVDLGYQPTGGTVSDIGDKVFFDADNNGTFGAGDTGLASITVYLYDTTGTNLLATTTTDGSGNYLFAGRSAGNYVVKVGLADADLPANYASTVANGAYASFTLTAGVNDLTKDFPFTFGYVAKTVNASSGSSGDTLTYTLTPYYPGNATPLTNATVVDTVPTGLTFAAFGQTGGTANGLTNLPPLYWGLGTNRAAISGSTNKQTTIAQRATTTVAVVSGTTLTLTKPTGLAVGDVMLAGMTISGNTTVPSLTGWTFVSYGPISTAGNGNFHTALLYRVAAAADVAAASFAFAVGSSAAGSGEIVAYSGVDTTGGFLVGGSSGGPFDVAPGSWTTNLTAGTSITGVAAITTVTNNAMVVMFVGAVNTTTITAIANTSPGTLTLMTESSNAGGSVRGANLIKATAGTTGSGTATLGTSRTWGAIQIALRAQTTNTTTALSVSSLMVTDPNVANTSIGTNVVVTLTLGSDRALTSVTPPASLVAVNSLGTTATATLVGTVSPATASISAGGTATFAYTYRLDVQNSTANWKENLTFTNLAFNSAGAAFERAVSPSVILTQSLTFTATVNASPGVAGLTNTSTLNNGGSLIYTSPQATTSLSGSIGDQVFYDFNNNDVYNAGTDTVLTNVTVRLYDSSGMTVLASTVTDSSGLYLFSGVTPGNYVVKVDLTDPDIPSGYISRVADGTYTSFALAGGQNLLTKDFPFQLGYLNKAVNTATAAAGNTLTYTLSPYYPGPDQLVSVKVGDTIPTGTTYVGSSANAGGTFSSPTVTWDLGSTANKSDGSSSLSDSSSGTIALRNASAVAVDNGTTTLTITKPASLASGDLMIANIGQRGTQTTDATRSGWTLIKGAGFETTGKLSRATLLYKVADSTDVAASSFAFTVAGSGGNFGSAGAIVAYSGVTATSGVKPDGSAGGPFDASPASYSVDTTGNSSAVSATGLTTATANAAIVMFAAAVNNDTFSTWNTVTTPGTLTELYDGGQASGNKVQIGAAWKLFGVGATGATGNGRVTLSASQRWAAELLALKPGTTSTYNYTTATSLSANRSIVTGADVITVTLTVTATGTGLPVTVTGPALSLTQPNGGTVVFGSASPATRSLSSGVPATFTYTSTSITPGTSPGTLTVRATPTDSNGTWPQATANTVIVTPPLTFNVTVDAVPGVTNVLNTGRLTNNGTLLYTSPRTTTAVTGSIGDTAYYDLNGNGIQSGVGETGATNVVVTLYNDTNGNGIFEPGTDTAVASTVTDASGNYLFSGLAPGNYMVVAEEQTVPAPTGSANAGLLGYMVSTTGTKMAVTLAPAQNYLTADFGFIEKGLLEGTTFWDKNHSGIFDAPDAARAGITVWLDTDNDGVLDWTDGGALNGIWDAGEGEQWVATNASGEYKFLVAPGSYNVRYDSADAQWAADNIGTGGEQTTPGSYSVTVASGQEVSNLDFGRDNKGKIGDTIFADLDSNGSQGAGEPGLQGVTVNLYTNPNGSAGVDGDEVFVESQVTDASGNYLFVGLADANYQVRVDTTATSLPSAFSTTPTAEKDGTFNSVNAAVISSGNSLLDLDFGYPLAPPASYSVSGTVWHDLNGDALITANGIDDATFVGLTVRAEIDLDQDGTPDFTLTTTTGAAGAYSFTGIPSGSNVRILVDETTLPSPGYNRTADPDVSNSQPLVLNGQTLITNLTSNKTGEDFGYQGVIRVGNRIWNDNGAGGGTANDGLINGTEPGINGVTVQVYAADTDGNPTGSVLATTTTASGGYYGFYLNPGDYVIVVPASNFGSGQPLENLFSSGTSTGTLNGIDPDTTDTDSDDNGFNAINPATTGVRTAAFTLTVGGEPTGETDVSTLIDTLAQAFANSSVNLTVDLVY